MNLAIIPLAIIISSFKKNAAYGVKEKNDLVQRLLNTMVDQLRGISSILAFGTWI